MDKIEQPNATVAQSAAAQQGGRPAPPARKLTYAEFLSWADEDTLAEWVNGDVVMSSPASERHQDVADFLTSILRTFVEQYDLGVVRSALFQMKLDAGREPDLLFVASAHLPRLPQAYLEDPADVAVEIVSPASAGRDRGAKFYEYARGGVPEYWLIDPQAKWAEFYQLENGHYRMVFGGREGRYASAELPGFWLQVEWLWQEPLPKVLAVLEMLGVV